MVTKYKRPIGEVDAGTIYEVTGVQKDGKSELRSRKGTVVYVSVEQLSNWKRMPDLTTPLWPKDDPIKQHYSKKAVKHLNQDQKGSSCVPTCLAMLVQKDSLGPKDIEPKINTQNPVTWSKVLQEHEMKLAYLPTDVRPLKMYLKELVDYDDLFLLAFYTGTDEKILQSQIVENDYQTGPSHVVLLHGNKIYDPAWTEIYEPAWPGQEPEPANTYIEAKRESIRQTKNGRVTELRTKRLFRVVPKDHAQGL
jgi:hypothetical protein